MIKASPWCSPPLVCLLLPGVFVVCSPGSTTFHTEMLRTPCRGLPAPSPGPMDTAAQTPMTVLASFPSLLVVQRALPTRLITWHPMGKT